MLDGILGRGLAPKCKSLIKLTKSRIDVLRRKRNATIKFLKKDLADLLANGLDVNAYGRAGGLLDELRLLWNLDFVEKSCDFVYKHLLIMQKMRECPEACREAVSSLMFAAAGFSELPELRDLRHMFHERYGDSLELFVNQEFVENLSSKPCSLEKKVKLMKDVASEFSIRWDSHAFEQRISRHNASVMDQHETNGLRRATSDSYKPTNENETVAKRDMYYFSSKERSEGSNIDHRLNVKKDNASERSDPVLQSTKELPSERRTPDRHKKHATVLGGDRHEFSSKERSESKHNEAERSKFVFQSRQEVSSERQPPYNETDTHPAKIGHENFFQGNRHENAKPWKVEDIVSKTPRSSSSSKRLEKFDAGTNYNGKETRKNIVPVSENLNGLLHGKPDITSETYQSKCKDKDPFGGNNWAGEYDNAKSTKKAQEEGTHDKPKAYFNNVLPPPYVKPNGKPKNSKPEASGYPHTGFDGNSVREDHFSHQLERAQVGSCHPDKEENTNRHFEPERANGHDHVKNPNHHDGVIENALPIRRSSRRKHAKSSSHDDFANPEDPGVVKRSRSRRRENSRRGIPVLFDDERDQGDEEERIIDKLLMHYSKKPSCYEQHQQVRVKSKSKSRNAGETGSDDMSEVVPPAARSISLPKEQTKICEPTRVFARAATFEPDRSSAARHVHPKLPDYDDLAARFAALKGR